MYCPSRRTAHAASFLLCPAVVAALTLLLPSQHAHAQMPTSRDTARADLEARQRALRNLERVKEKLSRRPPEPRLVTYQQTREDFEQLQLVNYRLAGVIAAGPALDYEQIRKDSAEVRKRASRLKSNLLLPEPAKDEKQQKSREELIANEELKPSIEALNALVNSFVWNPIFQQPKVLDVEHSVKARRDLEAIIKLSEQIHKRAEALAKATGKNH
jgi:hypothetical protein